MIRASIHVLTCVLLIGCSGANGDAPDELVEQGGAPAEVAAGSAAESRGPCSLFTPEEISGMLGRRVDTGQPSGPMNTSCQWESPTDEDAYAFVQVISDTEYWETRSGVRGYQTHPSVAREAFTAPEMGGWIAGALTESRVVFTSVNGGNASRELALEMLRTALQRLDR